MKPDDEFRKMLESTLSEALSDRENRVPNTETNEKLAKHLLGIIHYNRVGTSLPGDPPKPWAAMDEFESQREIALWSIEKYLATLNK